MVGFGQGAAYGKGGEAQGHYESRVPGSLGGTSSLHISCQRPSFTASGITLFKAPCDLNSQSHMLNPKHDIPQREVLKL